MQPLTHGGLLQPKVDFIDWLMPANEETASLMSNFAASLANGRMVRYIKYNLMYFSANSRPRA